MNPEEEVRIEFDIEQPDVADWCKLPNVEHVEASGEATVDVHYDPPDEPEEFRYINENFAWDAQQVAFLCDALYTCNRTPWKSHPPDSVQLTSFRWDMQEDGRRTLVTTFRFGDSLLRLFDINAGKLLEFPAYRKVDFNDFDFGRLLEPAECRQ